MAYRLKPGDVKATAIRRIMREQIGRAVAALSQDPVPPEGVHQARKVVKRLRSLLRLLEPSLDARDFKSNVKELGRLGDQLAGARDAHVMSETVAKLLHHFGANAEQALGPLVRMTASQVEGQAAHLSAERIQPTVAGFLACGHKLESLEIKGHGFACLAGGLQKSYSRARENFTRAYKKPDDERFHDLRKAVQWHQRHMVLLTKAWPEYFNVRVAACRELAQDLGYDHDLAMLIDLVERREDPAVDSDAVIQVARSRQAELRAGAFALAERLFEERPAAFTRRIRGYWTAAPLIRQDPSDKQDHVVTTVALTARPKPQSVRA